MLITCPNCSTRYTVADSAVPPGGRKVRCRSCGHVWFQRPVVEEEPQHTLLAEDFAPIRRPPPKPAKVKTPPRRGVIIGWAVFVLLLAGVGGGAYAGREQVVRFWPPAARLYALAGLPVDPPGTGLQLQNVRSEQRTENGGALLLVEGQILNTSDVVRPVPKVRAVSLGFDHKPVQSWVIETTSGQLLPGEIATFRSTQRDPGTVAEVMVTFEGG